MPLHSNSDLIQTSNMTQTEWMGFTENYIINNNNISSTLIFWDYKTIQDGWYIHNSLRMVPNLLHNYVSESHWKIALLIKYFQTLNLDWTHSKAGFAKLILKPSNSTHSLLQWFFRDFFALWSIIRNTFDIATWHTHIELKQKFDGTIFTLM